MNSRGLIQLGAVVIAGFVMLMGVLAYLNPPTLDNESPLVGAPSTALTYQKTLIPVSDSTYDLGTSTQAWRNVYADTVCLTADSCETTWPTGGGSGSVGTSTTPTIGQLSYWTTDTATPALLGSVATGTISAGAGISLDSAVRSAVGGALAISSTLGTSVDLTSEITGVLPVSNGGTGWANINASFIPYGNDTSAVSTSTHLSFADDGTIGTLTLGNPSTDVVGGAGSLVIVGDDSASILQTTYSDVSNSANLFRRALGTEAAPTVVVDGSVLGSIAGRGFRGSGSFSGSAASFRFVSKETFSATAQGAELQFWTTPVGSTATAQAQRLTINPSGLVGIGTTTPYAQLSVAGASGIVAGKIHATSSSDTSTFDTPPTFSTLTSALLLTGAGGLLAEYTGIDCTNQFVRDVSALGAGTCESVSLTADVTGDLPFANLAQVAANSVLANPTSATADAQSVATSTLYGANVTAGYVLMSNGSTWAPAATATCAAITGSAGLCDGDDATGAGGGAFAWTPSIYGTQAVNATSTGLWLKGSPLSLVASSTFSTYASSTQLTVSGSTWLTGLTSALVLAGSDGLLAEYAGIDCTNQFVRDVSAAGAGTCASISLSADVTGTLPEANGGTGDTDLDDIVGTANQLTVTNGANTIIAGDATLSLPAHVIFPGNFQATNSTTTNATTTSLNVTGAYIDFDNLTSALIVTGAGGILAEYGGAAACTNQFVTALDALGASTCASINNDQWSGTDLSVANGGTGASTLTGLLQGNGTSAITGITGTVGQMPYYNGTATLLATSTVYLHTNSFVGVGTTTPTWPLTVTSPTPIPQLALSAGAGFAQWTFANEGGNFTLATTSVAGTATSTPAALTILNSGSPSVIIGSSTPDTRISGFGFEGTAVFGSLTQATGGSNNDLCISSSNLIIEETTGVCVVSSRRFKHDIETLDLSGLDLINLLRPVTYSPNDDDVADFGNVQIGLIAEEVADVDPRFARYGTDGLPRTLDDRALLAATIKAVQELSDRVDALEKENGELKRMCPL